MNGSRFRIALVSLLFATCSSRPGYLRHLAGNTQSRKRYAYCSSGRKGEVMAVGKRSFANNIDQIDQATDPRPVSSFTFHDATVEFALDQDAGSSRDSLLLRETPSPELGT